MNPRSAMIRTLQEELNMCYNKMDFLKEEEKSAGHMPPVKTERENREPRKTGKAPRVVLRPEEDF